MALSDQIGKFTAIPNWVYEMIPEIGIDGLAMYSYLLMRQGQSESCFPSYDKMQKDLGIGRSRVAKLINALVVAGLIIKRRRYSASTVYIVISSKTKLLKFQNGTNDPSISSEVALMQFQNETTEAPISSEIEPPLVPKSNTNKTQLTRQDKVLNNNTAEKPDDFPEILSSVQAVSIFQDITGMVTIPNGRDRTVDHTIDNLYSLRKGYRKRDRMITDGKRYYAAWAERKYNLTNTAWVDWWISGSIPEQRTKGKKKPKSTRLTPEQIAETRREMERL